MPSKHPHIGPAAILVASILILGAAIYAALMTIAHIADAHQREIEQRIVESALNQQRMKLGGMMVQQAYWDTAYDAVGPTLDRAWIDTNFGVSAETAGVPLTTILDASGRPVYRFSGHATAAIAAAIPTSATLARLARLAEAEPALPPRPLTAIVRVGNTICLAAAQRIVPNDRRARQPLSRRYVLAYLLPIDRSLLRGFQSGFGVAPLSLAGAADPDLAHIPLPGAAGRPLAWLSWRAARPGTDFADEASPLAFACFLSLAALQLIVLRWVMQVARRMQDESVARTGFLANASHELRTPLNAIIGFSECMVAEMFGPLSPRYREYARDIRTSGQLLLGIVNDVLDLSQLNGVPDISLEPLKAGEALAGAVRMLREYAKDDDIAVDFVDRSNGAEVAASEKALSQILLNLGSNAVKFSPPQSAISIVLQRRAERLELVVSDRGLGIPAEKLRFIGQPFFQAHQISARKPGSGLGLAIVKKLTERLGGEFAIESAVGVGTTVTVSLPQLRRSESSRNRAA
ncbi:MAG TPA: ATP-binding protein [Rhizomicrobium sp.]|jgi:signal transduction histidine kinase